MLLDKIRFHKEVGISRQAPALGLAGHNFGFEAIPFAEGKWEQRFVPTVQCFRNRVSQIRCCKQLNHFIAWQLLTRGMLPWLGAVVIRVE